MPTLGLRVHRQTNNSPASLDEGSSWRCWLLGNCSLPFLLAACSFCWKKLRQRVQEQMLSVKGTQATAYFSLPPLAYLMWVFAKVLSPPPPLFHTLHFCQVILSTLSYLTLWCNTNPHPFPSHVPQGLDLYTEYTCLLSILPSVVHCKLNINNIGVVVPQILFIFCYSPPCLAFLEIHSSHCCQGFF